MKRGTLAVVVVVVEGCGIQCARRHPEPMMLENTDRHREETDGSAGGTNFSRALFRHAEGLYFHGRGEGKKQGRPGDAAIVSRLCCASIWGIESYGEEKKKRRLADWIRHDRPSRSTRAGRHTPFLESFECPLAGRCEPARVGM